MYTNGWTEMELEDALMLTHLRYNRNIEFANRYLEFRHDDRICYNVRIKPILSARLTPREQEIPHLMYRPGVLIKPTSGGGQRSCGACCWHAYGYFIRALFDINNDGWMCTRETKYRGLEGFLDTYPATGGHIKGGISDSACYEDMCLCYEYGLTDF